MAAGTQSLPQPFFHPLQEPAPCAAYHVKPYPHNEAAGFWTWLARTGKEGKSSPWCSDDLSCCYGPEGQLSQRVLGLAPHPVFAPELFGMYHHFAVSLYSELHSESSSCHPLWLVLSLSTTGGRVLSKYHENLSHLQKHKPNINLLYQQITICSQVSS